MKTISQKIVIIFILAITFITLGISYNYSYIASQIKSIVAVDFTTWQGDDRPTLIYDDYTFNPRNFPAEGESGIRILITAKQLGWNLLSLPASHKVPPKKLKNAIGIFIPTAGRSEEIFPKSVPVFTINYEYHSLDQINKTAQELLDDLKKSPYNDRVYGLLKTSYQPIDIRLAPNEEIGNLKFIMTWYPTTQITHYAPQMPTKLFYSNGSRYTGNDRVNSEKYINLWRRLDKTSYFAAYGHKSVWKGYESYKGYINADGESFIREINKAGACLILHKPRTLQQKIPTGRIFEAAAAAAIIISDKHPFIEKEFQDSVLYIDTVRDDLFEQIDAHWQWIQSHPEQAKAMAKRAHQIFLEKFTMEKQLTQLLQEFELIKH